MRKFLLSSAFAVLTVLLFQGCVNDGAVPTTLQERIPLYKFDLNSGQFEVMSIDGISLETQSEVTTRDPNPNSIIVADYLTTGSHHVQIRGSETPAGVNGEGSIEGPIYIDVEFDVACIETFDNRAIVGGQVTSLDLGDNPFEFELVVGGYLYLAIEDNSDGKSGRKDRYHGEVVFSPPQFGPLCFLLVQVVDFYWTPDDWNDVQGKNDRVIIR